MSGRQVLIASQLLNRGRRSPTHCQVANKSVPQSMQPFGRQSTKPGEDQDAGNGLGVYFPILYMLFNIGYRILIKTFG